ncbi:MAG TPA: hypothetical protein VF658_17530 [Pyrinomonadaceae bacterium]|jgi:hypothetical protein
MAQAFIRKAQRGLTPKLWLCTVLALLYSACAATPPPDPTGPRPNDPRYPVTLTENADRQQATLAAWERLTTEQGINSAPAPELQPVTASIRSLPALTNTPLYLPKIGDPSPQATAAWEDATTEALRRFINDNARLFGAEAPQLSLVLLTNAADGTKKAKYQQRPFRYPLRNGFGELEISFTNDRRILQITSTCIPEVEQLRLAGSGNRPRYSSDEVARRMVGRTFTYADTAGNAQNYSVQAGDVVTVRELVIYPMFRPGQTSVLDFHLAWEVLVGREQKRTVYVDAITDEIIAVAAV